MWQDVNGDGVRATDASTGAFTDPGLSNWTVFVDLNNNRTPDTGEPSTLTNSTGLYTFENLTPGDYEVTEVLPSGWEVAPTFDTRQTVAVADGVVSSGNDFANVDLTNGSIQGVVWNDFNGDGLRAVDPVTGNFTEPGLTGWTMFLDTNNNRSVDVGEPTTLTDANGAYAFSGLLAGDYEVTEVLPSGWNVSPLFDSRQTVTVTGGQTSTAGDFANFSSTNGSIRGSIWNDVNANGTRDVDSVSGLFTEPVLVGWTVFLDLNGNGAQDTTEPTSLTDAAGSYRFADLQVGDYDVIEVLPAGWETAPTFDDNYTVAVFGGSESVAPDFANHLISTTVPGSVSGVVWNDLNGNGVREVDATKGEFTDPGLGGWTVYVDLNGNRALDPSEPQTTSDASGVYTISNVTPGTISVVVAPVSGWRSSAPVTNVRTITVRNGQAVTGQDFGNAQLKDSTIRGTVYADGDKNGSRGTSERGLPGITVYLDANDNGILDAGEVQTVTSEDLFFTPDVNEAGTYSFTHLAGGNYVVREILPVALSATPASQLVHSLTITNAEDRAGVDTAAVFRANEIHGVKFNDLDGNHQQDPGETGISGATVFVDLNRNNALDDGEPTTVTGGDGSYTFTNLTPGAYVVREVAAAGYQLTYPQTLGGILWPTGVSNPAVGNVTPSSITTSLTVGQSYRQSVSLTLPSGGALTNMVDVFLLFDDTGSFVNNSPIVRDAFPTIISQLQTALPGIDLGFGVGRFEEYANYAWEYSSGRPFVLNQPIVAASTPGYMTAIQAGLNRETPGYGGDQPETDIEALYQVVTGRGFDGNNNGSVLDSGAAGLASTQLNPGISGDVPSFASFQADPANSVMAAAGNVGGAGFRAGALPIILTATDTGFAYQPKGESVLTGVNGTTLPLSAFTETSRPDTPFNSGAGLQETITGLNALGALVIGLGTNPEATLDPRQGLEALSLLTGAVNRSTTTIDNGTTDPIAPGDPLYFQIASGFGSSVANGVVNAIQNAVTNVAVDITLQASDPRVKIINHTGTLHNIGGGQTATFDVEFIGDGAPRRFDLQFVRAGTNVVLGSIPVVIGTPVPGDGYEYTELEDGEIETKCDFGAKATTTVFVNNAPNFTKGTDQTVLEDASSQTIAGWATSISPGPASESGQAVDFIVTTTNAALFSVQPTIAADGTLSYTPAANANGSATVTVKLHDDGGTANGGVDTSPAQTFTITVTAVNDAPVAVDDAYTTAEDTALNVLLPGVLSNDSDIDSSSLTAAVVTGPSHGTLTLNADGSFTYTPVANYNGPDSFSYQVSDGTANSNVAIVALTVTAVNDAPVAVDDAYTTAEDMALNVLLPGLLANDSDIDSSSLTAAIVTGPSHGSLMLNADGSFTYMPAANYNGPDSFSYQVNDGATNSNVATVALSVTAVNDAPVANGDAYTLVQNGVLTIAAPGVLGNDHDVDGDPLSTVQVAAPTHGTLTLNANGGLVYTPFAGYSGPDSFTYVANDGTASSNLATVNLQITPVMTGGTKFFVVDSSARGTFGYDANGFSTSQVKLNRENSQPRGIASNRDGSKQWTVDQKGDVFIYNDTGKLLGSWTAKGLGKPEGITTDGVNIWIADDDANRVYYFAGAASRLKGSISATSSFALNRSNSKPMDVVTDGTHLWVVNDTNKLDRVFRYTIAGTLEGSWQIDAANKTPTGLTIDPNDVNHIWIVDAGTDRVYQYNSATTLTTGAVKASSSFALSTADRNPQGIADPRLKSTARRVTSERETAHDAVHAEHAINKALPESRTAADPSTGWAWLAHTHESKTEKPETHAIDKVFDSLHDEFESHDHRTA